MIVLSRLRNLHEEIEQKVNDMPITYDIKNDSFYNRGIREGRIQKGMEKGMEKTKKEIALNLIKAGFDNETISKATSLSTEKIQKLRK